MTNLDYTACCKPSDEEMIEHLEKQVRMRDEEIGRLMQIKHVLTDLLAQEVQSNNVNMNLLRDVSDERDKWRRKYQAIHRYLGELEPGKRLTKEILEQLNKF